MIFDVTPDQVAKLSDEDLRTLVGRLCEAEVRALGLTPVGITYGSDQNTTDGGIDVRPDVPAAAAVGFVPRAVRGFQVKAEDLPRRAIREEMRPFGHRSVSRVLTPDSPFCPPEGAHSSRGPRLRAD
jgi:hypothetical protein